MEVRFFVPKTYCDHLVWIFELKYYFVYHYSVNFRARFSLKETFDMICSYENGRENMPALYIYRPQMLISISMKILLKKIMEDNLTGRLHSVPVKSSETLKQVKWAWRLITSKSEQYFVAENEEEAVKETKRQNKRQEISEQFEK